MERQTLTAFAGAMLAFGTWACSDSDNTMNPSGSTPPGTAGTVAGAGAGAAAGTTAPPTAGGIATAGAGAAGSSATAGTAATAGAGGSAGTSGSTAGAGTAGTSAAAGGQATAGEGGSAGAAGSGSTDVGTDPLPPLADSVALPLVFVHGFAGSAQQYQSQKTRFVANGYPADRIVAYEHNGEGSDTAGFAAGLSTMVDQVMMKFGTTKVYLAAHSRGGGVVGAYLNNNAAKVAKYAALDAIGGCSVPSGVACLSLTQAMLSQKHVEVATSAESFKRQYKHFIGEDPKVVDIVRQKGLAEIAGRAVNFPANTGRTGATVNVWEVDGNTGARTGMQALATFMVGADGNWGPAKVDPDKFYELELVNTEGGATQHFYAQRYLRSSDFVRLLTGGPNSDSSMNTNKSDKHVALLVTRQREWQMTGTEDKGGDDPDRASALLAYRLKEMIHRNTVIVY